LVPAGLRLIPPEGCPDVIQKLMTSCWKPEPSERITFELILYELENSRKRIHQVKILLTNSQKIYKVLFINWSSKLIPCFLGKEGGI
jgi:hypothetical protein